MLVEWIKTYVINLAENLQQGFAAAAREKPLIRDLPATIASSMPFGSKPWVSIQVL
jgi:hypothetical protein